jgi:hypothetical protein
MIQSIEPFIMVKKEGSLVCQGYAMLQRSLIIAAASISLLLLYLPAYITLVPNFLPTYPT